MDEQALLKIAEIVLREVVAENERLSARLAEARELIVTVVRSRPCVGVDWQSKVTAFLAESEQNG